MKKNRHALLAGLLLVGCQAMAQTAPASPAPSSQEAPVAGRAGFLKSVTGDVQIVNAAGASRQAHSGDPVSTTEQVVTAAGAGAGIVLRDGTTLVVGPSSQLDLKQFQFDATTHDGGLLVSLIRGSMRMISGLLGKTHPEGVKVETQTATIGIRGTDFIVTADGT